MARLSGSVAAAVAGDVPDPMWMGKVCCWLIAACAQGRDVTRAADWCRRVEALCLERDLDPLFNVCRIQWSSVQLAQGAWPEAEQQLTAVLDRLRRRAAGPGWPRWCSSASCAAARAGSTRPSPSSSRRSSTRRRWRGGRGS